MSYYQITFLPLHKMRVPTLLYYYKQIETLKYERTAQKIILACPHRTCYIPITLYTII